MPISASIQFNYDRYIGPTNDGSRGVVNVQPVLQIVSQRSISSGAGRYKSGMDETVQSKFFASKKLTAGGIWGAGPVLLLPEVSNALVRARKCDQGRRPWIRG